MLTLANHQLELNMNKTFTRFLVVTAGVTGLALGLGAVTHAGSGNRIHWDNVTVDMPGAVAIALESVLGDVIGVELERERGDIVWEIEIADERGRLVDLELDAISGSLLKRHVDDDLTPDVSGFVSLNEALAAVASIETGSFVEAELEVDDGVPVWKIKTLGSDNERQKHRVDAAGGTVL
jgi:uncharacterized membrane protein YkoI